MIDRYREKKSKEVYPIIECENKRRVAYSRPSNYSFFFF